MAGIDAGQEDIGARVLAALSRRPLLALALLCLILWTPGILSLPALDRDESRFAQSSRQMLESRDFVDIRFGAEPRYKKPVAIYWLQAATTALAGLGAHDRIWTYRIASLLGGIASAWLAWWSARAIASPRVALLGAALLASTLLLSAEASIATTDAVLLACILGAQGTLLRHYLVARGATDRPSVSRGVALWGWVALGLGILVKGPVAPGVCAATALALSIWDRDARWLRQVRPVQGLVIVALIVAPWAIAIAIASHGQFYSQSLGTDFAAKLAGAQEAHGAPPGYYLALATITLWPATLFVLPGLRDAVARRTEAPIRFLLAWAGSVWLLFEATPTKLPHYILPAYPAVALLAALWALGEGSADAIRPRWRWGALVQFSVGGVALIAALLMLPGRYGQGIDVTLIALAALAVAVSLVAMVMLARRRNAMAAAGAIVAAALVYGDLTAIAAPRLDRLWLSSRLQALVTKDSHPTDPPLAVAGFEEPSLVFALDARTILTDGSGAARAAATAGGLALVEDRERSAFLGRLSALHAVALKVDEVTGLNYSRGRSVHVAIYRVSPSRTVVPRSGPR